MAGAEGMTGSPSTVAGMPAAGTAFRVRPRSRLVRLGRIVTLAVVIGIGINHVWWALADWHLRDMNAYWDAAVRLREGQPLFSPAINIEASEVYRYSPWFAWLWVPLTFLPRLAVNIIWSTVLMAASAAAVLPLAQRRKWVLVAFFLPILIAISAGGNVQALLIATLILGVERRSGPVWIAAAASLKLFPFLLVLAYVARREWRRALVALVLTALLLAPFLLYDLSGYITDAGGAALLWRWPLVYSAVVVVSGLVTIRLGRTRYRWLVAAFTVTMALPRFFLYDVTYLMIGVADGSSAVGSSAVAASGQRPPTE